MQQDKIVRKTKSKISFKNSPKNQLFDISYETSKMARKINNSCW